FSHGKNGLGAINASTGTANPAPSSLLEQDNLDGFTTFVSRVQSPAGAPAGEFDDIVIWLSKNTLFNRMVAAGKLP
ncbi:MAG: type II secretion system protein, partial [Burkholderiales bacterium]